ncbi:MAG TPA: hypothetical protein VGD40_11915 [Chryseosolibacter sp.]
MFIHPLFLMTMNWIQRHRPRLIDGETALAAIGFFVVLITVVVVIKWQLKKHRGRY